jgi:mono/diheme cytochrome c family protein
MNYRIVRRSIEAMVTACLFTPTCLLVVPDALADDSAFTSMAGLGSANGPQIYSHICQGCHMPGGVGAVGAGHYPKLAGDPALVAWEYAAITVLNGKHGMPAFGLPQDQVMETRSVHLSDAQVADVVNYVRTNFGNHYKSNVTAQQVAKLPHPGAAPPTED